MSVWLKRSSQFCGIATVSLSTTQVFKCEGHGDDKVSFGNVEGRIAEQHPSHTTRHCIWTNCGIWDDGFVAFLDVNGARVCFQHSGAAFPRQRQDECLYHNSINDPGTVIEGQTLRQGNKDAILVVSHDYDQDNRA